MTCVLFITTAHHHATALTLRTSLQTRPSHTSGHVPPALLGSPPITHAAYEPLNFAIAFSSSSTHAALSSLVLAKMGFPVVAEQGIQSSVHMVRHRQESG